MKRDTTIDGAFDMCDDQGVSAMVMRLQFITRHAVRRAQMRLSGAVPVARASLMLIGLKAVAAGVLLAANPAFGTDATPLSKDFPSALAGNTRQLEFHAARPSGTGSIEGQVKTELKELFSKSGSADILKLRVFAVGPDDLVTARRIIFDTFSATKRRLPVLSLVGVAALPEHGQRVAIESTALGKRRVNPFGLAFLAGFASPRGEQTVDGLARVARESGLAMPDVTRVSCFYQAPEQSEAARTAIAATFPTAESSFVLSVAAESNPVIECEAVARLNTSHSDDVRYFNLPGTKASPYFSRAALVSASKVILTGTETALGDSQQDARDPFDRAKRAVERLGGKLADVAMADNYWVTTAARDRNREVRGDYFGQTVPAASGVFFAGLSSSQATQAIEFVVALPDTVILKIGSSPVDGRALYKSHLATFVDSVTKDGVVVRMTRSTLDKFATQRNGVPVFRLLMEPSTEARGPGLRAETVLNRQTLALIHREERDDSGRVLVADVDGAHITGLLRSAPDAPSEVLDVDNRHSQSGESLDFTLDTPSYFLPFLDAVANAMTLRADETLQFPSFDFSSRKTQWHTYRVTGRDRIIVGGHRVDAWVIEEDGQSGYTLRKIWLIKVPPYFPLDLRYLPDGSVRRIEQTLVREHP
jgi:enamine deaminase RidA (YjgF/YER057c/UK114 family)